MGKTVEELYQDGNKRELFDALEYYCKRVENQYIDSRRWSTVFTRVVLEKETGKYYKYTVYEPATECQEFDINYDFEFIGEVKPIEETVVITKYVNV